MSLSMDKRDWKHRRNRKDDLKNDIQRTENAYAQDNLGYCEICMSAFRACTKGRKLSDQPHHNTLQSLRDSAEFGCPACNELLQELPAQEQSDTPSDSLPLTTYWFGDEHITFNIPKLDYDATHWSKIQVEVEEIREELRLRTGKEDSSSTQQSVATIFGESTGSEQSWRLIQHWVTRCDQHHQSCKRVSDTPSFPTRLIYVGSETEIPRLYLPDVASWNPHERYTTLSHCWGPDPSQVFQLRTENLDHLKQKLHLDGLPQTFKDAIDITKRLGVRFLWIDSLCIIQDDDNDWAREAASMSKIYSDTYLNISATAARDGREGCYRRRDLARVAPLNIHSHRKKSPQVHLIVPEGIWEDNVDYAPLNKRAWVLQERLLSTRVLHFSTDQVLWECCENYACETFPRSVPHHLRGSIPSVNSNIRDLHSIASHGIHGEKQVAQLWAQIVDVYSGANLTFREDKLVALSGVARKLGNELNISYAAGLWKCYLPSHLLWYTYSGYRPKEYVAPSWSWASVEGQVRMQNRLDTSLCAALLHLEIELVNPNDPFGQIKSGWIQLRGRLGVVSWKSTKPVSNVLKHTPISLANYVPPSQLRAEIDNPKVYQQTTLLYIFLDDTQDVECQQMFFFPISLHNTYRRVNEGLLLQMLPDGTFARIGMLDLGDDRWEEIFASFDERDITIV
ncbi:heterokaryon incompatibility protein-domain-containing protein [Lophiotrema nucula]|uniref:Heterokaryon incompatibility protein-domain-containing protein n=1 Tax=Lophiotrema nucula TaxID=690887 RepID=A0A6A5YUS5_9PLEO|nr:heterokaryon incompatibility protein-domain-containing protein [Lophiotrema nucula]